MECRREFGICSGKEGRIQSDINANRQKTENRIREEWIDKYCEIAEKSHR
jgi:hypothetical protein